MAYTKIHPIKCTVDKAISYITNPEKTDKKLLVSSFACSEPTAFLEFEMTRNKFHFSGLNLAYHCIQSFKQGEITPEQAHLLGIQTADEFLKGKYEYVIATHVDRQNIHNHIIINGVNFENGLAFGTEHDRKNNPAWKQLRKISDDICIENKLSVISMPEKGYGKCYYEWLQDQRDNSYKSLLKNAIDKCIMTAENFDDFLEKMKSEKYEYKLRGNTLSFRADGQERFTRCSRKRLGWYYEPEQIQKRIDRQVRKRSAAITSENGFIEVHNDSAVGLKHWAAIKNMQEASRILNMLAEYGVSSEHEIETKLSELYDRRFDLMAKLNLQENTISGQRELLKMLNTYWETKPIHDEYIQLGSSEKFKHEHTHELSVFNATKEWLRERYKGTTLPNRAVLELKISEQESEREELLELYHDTKKSLNTLEKAKAQIEAYLDSEQHENDRKKSNDELE